MRMDEKQKKKVYYIWQICIVGTKNKAFQEQERNKR